MLPTYPNLTELVSLEDWQKIQYSLSEVLDIAVTTFSSEGKLLSKTSRHNRLCSEILPKVSKDLDSCISLLLKPKVNSIKDIKEETNFKGPFDLEIFVVPIKPVADKIIAYLVLGPVILKKRRDISEYAEEAKKFGITLDELEDALIEISVFSYNKSSAIIKLVKDVFSQISKTAYHKRRLADITSKITELDPLFARHYEEKILNALLNCCTLALNADSGSVMTLDHKTNMLHVKVASRLDEEIVKNAEVKLGEGIAGIAAANAESIILPKDMDKNGLSEKMKRRYIKSSLIVPFHKRNAAGVYGVINLNIIRKKREFSENDIALVRELVNMASVALFPLKQDDTNLDVTR